MVRWSFVFSHCRTSILAPLSPGAESQHVDLVESAYAAVNSDGSHQSRRLVGVPYALGDTGVQNSENLRRNCSFLNFVLVRAPPGL